MKTLILSGLIIITPLLADAAQKPHSRFDVLGDMFDTGTPPQLSKLLNVAWTGRCFHPEDGDYPRNGGYIFRSVKAGSKTVYQAMNYSLGFIKPAHFFDSIGYNKILSAEFWNGLNIGYNLEQSDFEKWFFDVSIVNGAIVGTYNNNVTSTLKVSGEYLVEETLLTESDIPAERCYYFVPPHPAFD